MLAIKPEAISCGSSYETSDHVLRLLLAHGSPLSADVISDFCRQKRLSEWLQLFRQFKPCPADQSKDLKTVKGRDGKDVSLDAADQAFLRRVAAALDLDFGQSWQFVSFYFQEIGHEFDGQSSKESPDFKLHQMHTQEHLNGIVKLYSRERLASIDCLSQIFKCAITPQTWFQTKASELIGEIVKSKPQFISDIISALNDSARKGIPMYVMSDSDREVVYTNQRRLEQQFLSELLFWSTLQLDLTLNDRLKALKDLAEFINLAKGFEAPLRNDYIISSLANLLDISHSGRITDSSIWKGIMESNPLTAIDIDKTLRQITNTDFQGFILFIWAGLLSQFMDQMSGSMLRSEYEDLSMYFEHTPAAANLPPLFAQYAMNAFSSNNLPKMLQKLQKPDFLIDRPENKTAICASIVPVCLSFLRGFEIENLPIDNVVIQLLIVALSDELLDLIDISKICDSVQLLFEYYLALFPAYFDVLFDLLKVVSRFPDFPKNICQRLNELPYFPQNAKYVDINSVSRETETEYRTTRQLPVLREIFKSFDFLVIDPNTTGVYQVLEGTSKAVMRWQVTWSFWELLANVFIDFASRSRDILIMTNGNEKSCSFAFLEKLLPFLQNVVRNYHSIGDELDNELGKGLFVSVFPSIMENTAKLIDDLSSVQVQASASMDLIASLIDLMEAFAVLYPDRILSHVRSSNLISHQTCHVSSIFHQQERPAGRYPVTTSIIRLIDRLVLEIRRSVYSELFRAVAEEPFDEFETLNIYLHYVVSTIFAGLQSWKFRYYHQKLELSKQCLSIISLVLSDPAPVKANDSKKLRKQKECKLLSYGKLCKSILDIMLFDENSISSLLTSIIGLCERRTLTYLYSEYGSKATSVIENGLELIHLLLTYRLGEPEKSQTFESVLLGLNSSGIKLNYIESTVNLMNTDVSERTFSISIKCLLQVATLISGWTPRPPSLASYVNPAMLTNVFMRSLNLGGSQEIKSLILRFITLSLSTQPSLAFEILLTSNPEKSELIKWILEKLKGFSKLLDDEVHLAYSLSEFLRQMWKLGTAFEKTTSLIRKDGNLWIQLNTALFSDKGIYLSTTTEDVAGHVRNAATANLIFLISSELCFKSNSKSHIDSILKNICSRLQVIVLMAKSINLRPEVLQDLNMLAGNQFIDAEIFRKNSWCGQFSEKLEFGKSFLYTIQGLKSSGSDLAEILEQINLEFSLRDSQMTFCSNLFNLLSIMIAKDKLVPGSLNSNSCKELLSLVFDSPQDAIKENIQAITANFLTHAVKHMPTSELISYTHFIASILPKFDMKTFEDKLRKEFILSTSDQGYFELMGQVLMLLFTSLNKGIATNQKLDIDQFEVLMRFITNMIVTAISKFQLSQNSLNMTRCWLLALSSLLKSLDYRKSKLVNEYFNECAVLHHLMTLSSEIINSDLNNTTSTCVTILDIFGQLSESVGSKLIVEHNVVENMQRLKIFESQSVKTRPHNTERLLISLITFLSNLVQSEGSLEKVSFSVIHYLDQIVPQTKMIFSKFENNLNLSAMHLNLCEQFSKLLSNMSKYCAVWQYRYFAFGDYYTNEFLKIDRYITDILVHPNRFTELLFALSSKGKTNKSNGKNVEDQEKSSDPQYRKVQLQLCRILRNIYMTVYQLTESGKVFLLSSSEWSRNAVVFVPVLEVTSASIGTTFGTMNIMLAFARDRIESALSKSAAQTADRQVHIRVLSELVQLIFLVFTSQTFYALESSSFDQRQKEQVKMEVIGEIVAAIDAYNERFETTANNKDITDLCQLLTRLRSFIETQIR